MATSIPSALKSADIQRFAHRAQQLERVKPIVSYWCEYCILQKILATGLHTTDPECQTYAIQLMDKLEQTKSENPTNDAIVDDVAAKAYIENFALETFNRAEDSQRQNKVTRQTIDTFQAALTFFDLLSIWGEVDMEVKAKSRFAKYHAVRIAKAIKNGEDPNATNPVIEEPKAPEPGEEGIEAELRDLERTTDAGVVSTGSAYRPPTVESAPDSMQPSRPESTRPEEMGGIPPTAPPEPDVSPIEPAESTRQDSLGGGYFPSVPDAPAANVDVEMTSPDQPATFGPPSTSTHLAPQTQPSPSTFYNQPPADPLDPPTSPDRPSRPPPEQMDPQPPPITTATAGPPAQTPLPAFAPPPPVAQPPPPSFESQPAPLVTPAVEPAPVGGYRTDDESVMQAQKHARWAISALNFEDVNTAVKELRVALRSLGAS